MSNQVVLRDVPRHLVFAGSQARVCIPGTPTALVSVPWRSVADHGDTDGRMDVALGDPWDILSVWLDDAETVLPAAIVLDMWEVYRAGRSARRASKITLRGVDPSLIRDTLPSSGRPVRQVSVPDPGSVPVRPGAPGYGTFLVPSGAVRPGAGGLLDVYLGVGGSPVAGYVVFSGMTGDDGRPAYRRVHRPAMDVEDLHLAAVSMAAGRSGGAYLRNISQDCVAVCGNGFRIRVSERIYVFLDRESMSLSIDASRARLVPVRYDFRLPSGSVRAYRGMDRSARSIGYLSPEDVLARSETFRESRACRVLSSVGPGREVWLSVSGPDRIHEKQGLNGEFVVELSDFESNGPAFLCLDRVRTRRGRDGGLEVFAGREREPVEYFLAAGDLGLRPSFRIAGELGRPDVGSGTDKALQPRQYGCADMEIEA